MGRLVGRPQRRGALTRRSVAAATALRRVARVTAKRHESSVGAAQVLAAERAEGVLAVAGSEVVEGDAPGALRRELAHDVGQRHAGVAGRANVGIPADEGERLEMDPAHRRQTFEGEVEDAPKLVEVDPAHDGGHEHHAQAGLRAVLHGTLLQGGQRTAAQGEVSVVVDAVELQEDRLQAGGGQRLRVLPVRGEPQPVGVELQKGNSERAPESNDLPAGRRASSARRRIAARCSREPARGGAGTTPRSRRSRGRPAPPSRALAKQIGHSRSQRAVTSSSTQQVCRA